MSDPTKHQIQTAAGIGYAEPFRSLYLNHAAALTKVYAALGVEAADAHRIVGNVVKAPPDLVTTAIETLRGNVYRLTEAHRQALLEIVEEAAEAERDPETYLEARFDQFSRHGDSADEALLDARERAAAANAAIK